MATKQSRGTRGEPNPPSEAFRDVLDSERIKQSKTETKAYDEIALLPFRPAPDLRATGSQDQGKYH